MESPHTKKTSNSGHDVPLRIAAERYWYKPMAILFNALQIRALGTASFSWQSSILDIGCNDGECGVMFAKAWGPPGSLIGIDVAKEAIAAAGEEAHAMYTRLVHGDASRMPFAEGQFDTILSNASLFAIRGSLKPALEEMSRVLQPGGHVAVTVCTDQYEQHYWITKLLRWLKLKRWAERYTAAMNRRMLQEHRYSPEEWCRQFESAGFSVTRCVGFIPLEVVPFWSFLAWTPLRVLGVLKWLPAGAIRRMLQRGLIRLFKPLYDRTPVECRSEDSGYILIEARKPDAQPREA